MKLPSRTAFSSAAASLALASCALSPVVPADAPPQSLQVTAHRWGEHPAPLLGWGTSGGAQPEPLAGVECIASNDRGSWTVMAPGTLQVARSKSALKVTCRKEGYKDSRVELRCITPRIAATAGGTMAGLQLGAAAGPALAAAMPPVGVAIAVVAGVAALGGAVGHALGGTAPDPDLCAYGAGGDLQVWMRPG